MSTLPTKREELVSWCQNHAGLWTTAPTSIGLTAAQVLAFKNLATATNEDLLAQEAARDAALAATKTVDSSISQLRAEASALVVAIRSYAINTDNPSVYQTAQIPPPATPGTVPPPGQPKDFKTTINPGGTLTLDWKCKNPSSGTTVYTILRQLPTETGFTLLGVTGDKFYVDETLPFGVDQVSYIVTAQRGSTMGPASQELTVRFGSLLGGGRAVKSVSTNTVMGGTTGESTATTDAKKVA